MNEKNIFFCEIDKDGERLYTAGKTAGSQVIADAAGGSVTWTILLGDNVVTWV